MNIDKYLDKIENKPHELKELRELVRITLPALWYAADLNRDLYYKEIDPEWVYRVKLARESLAKTINLMSYKERY